MTPVLLEGKKVAIIGAGPVGLITAVLLQKKGAQVKVYERDINSQARISGGTLDIHKDTGQQALEKAGLLDVFYQYARPTGECSVDRDANILADEMPDEAHRYDRPEIDRNDLRRMLLDHLDADTIAWDHRLVSVTEANKKFTLHFANDKTETADLVIIANGGMSGIRQLITDAVPAYTGTYIIQGEVERPGKGCPVFHALSHKKNLVAVSDKMMLYAQTKSNGALNYYVSFKAKENWADEQKLSFKDKTSVVTFLNTLFQDWHPCFRELFAATDLFTGLPMRKMPLDKAWKNNTNITLVGDAAHVMPPFAGIGVNIGLLDALYLTENLTNTTFPDIQSAIRDYQQKMFVYAGQAQQDTSDAETSIHSGNPMIEIWADRESRHNK